MDRGLMERDGSVNEAFCMRCLIVIDFPRAVNERVYFICLYSCGQLINHPRVINHQQRYYICSVLNLGAQEAH
jgi:hypothetical protein